MKMFQIIILFLCMALVVSCNKSSTQQVSVSSSSSETKSETKSESVTENNAETKTEVVDGIEKIIKSDAEWKKLLTPEQYYVTRQHGTERAFTGEYNDTKKKGIFHCIACDLPLFDSEHKFDSGTGWPSYWQPIDEKYVGETEDNTLFMNRTEVHCNRCGAHLGHVFPDGPKPTGLRYCINSVSLKLKEKEAEAAKTE